MADEHILITSICTELRKSWSGLLTVVEREGSLRVSETILLHGEWFLFKEQSRGDERLERRWGGMNHSSSGLETE